MSNPDYRTFSLAGTHYEMGYILGQASPQFSVPSWWPLPPDASFANACADEIALIHAPLLEEIHGYADGQQQPYEDFLRVLTRRRLRGRLPRVPETGGCTSFAWRAEDGRIMVGRNYDFHPMQRIRQRIHAVPNEGIPSVGVRGSVPVGRYDGVNRAGLFICLHVVLADAPKANRPGIPFHLIPRLILETCESVGEALDKLLLMHHLHSFNYLIADAEQFVAVEAHADRVKIVYPERDVLAVGNFYQHPQMAPLQGRRKQTVSRQRVQFLEDYSTQPHGNAWQATLNAMQDRTVPVCGTRGQHTTLWSCVVDLTEQKLAYAKGSPLDTPYETIPWA